MIFLIDILTLQVCTEEDMYVQRLSFASQNLLRLRRVILVLHAHGLFLTGHVKSSLWQRLHFILKWFQPNSFEGSVLLREELQKYAKNSNFDNFESALYSTSFCRTHKVPQYGI